jgi:hypothetical protein
MLHRQASELIQMAIKQSVLRVILTKRNILQFKIHFLKLEPHYKKRANFQFVKRRSAL